MRGRTSGLFAPLTFCQQMNMRSEIFKEKVTRALRILERTGMDRGTYLPPMYPAYWKLGIRIPPPHFMSFGGVALVNGLPLGLCVLGLCMMDHETWATSPLAVLLASAVTTLIWGAAVATYYRAGRLRHRLPSWNSV